MPQLTDEIINKIIGLIVLKLPKKVLKEYYKLLSEVVNPALLLKPECLEVENTPLLSHIRQEKLQEDSLREIEKWRRDGIDLIALGEDVYPQQLTNIFQPPPILFYRGNWQDENQFAPSLAIVGSRKADDFGCELAHDFAAYAVGMGICIVSGLAYGVDTFAHRGALTSKNPFPTIAVLGNGLNSIYPPRNEHLARQILEKGGMLCSQFHPDEKPYPANFLNRNRIIAGLAGATVVIQAPERSGSLATARFALDEGREVLVVPGAINDMRYSGSLKLIQSGAHLLRKKEEILDFYPNIQKSLANVNNALVDCFCHEERIIIEKLQRETMLHLDELQALLGDKGLFTKCILDLEVKGYITQEAGNYIRLRQR